MGHTSQVWALLFLPDGKTLVSAATGPNEFPGSGVPEIKLWNVVSGQDMITLRGHADSIKGIAYAPSINALISASKDKTVRLWDIDAGGEKVTLQTGRPFGDFAAIAPDLRRVASRDANELAMWDVSTSKKLATFPHIDPNGKHFAFSPDGVNIAAVRHRQTD